MLALQIAKRYLIAKKSHQAVNIISLVSMIGVAVGSMALIIVLSVFNGFGNLVLSLYNSFDPDVKITAVAGKTFDPASFNVEKIKQLPGVKLVHFTLEENALLRYRERQYIVTIKGVSDDFLSSVSFSNKIIDGLPLLQEGDTNFALVGGQIAYSLGLQLDDPLHQLYIYIPKRTGKLNAGLDPAEAFISRNIYAAGVFSIQQDFDSKYVLIPLRLARELIDHEKNVSALEITLNNGESSEQILGQIQSITGNGFHVKDRLAQHDFLYKIIRSEKTVVFLILSFILLIATFNVVGSLTMLIIEKKKDIILLLGMGADLSMIKKIFLFEGLLISLIGALSGLLLGGLVCALQQVFGIIKLENAEAFVINAYPVNMQWPDFIMVFITVNTIGFLAAWYTSSRIVEKQIPQGLK